MVFSFKNCLAASVCVSALLAGCGGGGGGDATPAPIPVPTPVPQGVYGGTLTGSVSKNFELLMLDNGELWSLYGTETSTAFGVAGFVQGTGGSTSDGKFASLNTKDFGFSPAVNVTTFANYDATAKTISGTVSSPANGTVTFIGGPIPGSLYNYDKPAALATIAGSWSLSSLTGEGITLNIESSGQVTAISSLGCQFKGNVQPRPSGKNVFNVSISFGTAPCARPSQIASGIAVAYPLANGQTQLLVSVVDVNRTYGVAAFGVASTPPPPIPAVTPVAQGAYAGTLTGSASKNFEFLMLDNNQFWSLYGTETSTGFVVTGFLQGSLNTVGIGGISASQLAWDYGFNPAAPVTAVVGYNPASQTLSGTVSSAAAGAATFSGGPIPGSLYNYNTPAVLTTIAGTWTLSSLAGESIVLNVTPSTGSFTASSSGGCNFVAFIGPRSSGKNVFDVSLTFGAAPCALPNQKASGIALAYPLATGKTQLIVTAIDNNTRTYGTAAFGTR
jgi:hypothetical protein